MFPTTLGDLSTSPYAVLGDCVDHRACLHSQLRPGTRPSLFKLCTGTVSDHSSIIVYRVLFSVTYELDSNTILFFRPCYKAHTMPSNKLGDYIGTMHLAMHLSIRISTWIFVFRP